MTLLAGQANTTYEFGIGMGKSGGGRMTLGGFGVQSPALIHDSSEEGSVFVSVDESVNTGRETRNQIQVWLPWVGTCVIGSM